MAATITTPKGPKADKVIRDALLAVQRQEPERLKRIALAWWDAAETDQQSRNALADRLDGKVSDKVELTGANGGPVETKINDLDKIMLEQYISQKSKGK